MTVLPLLRRHSYVSLEGAEERHLVSKARLQGNGSHLDVRLADKQLLGIVNTVGVDKLREGTATCCLDTI